MMDYILLMHVDKLLMDVCTNAYNLISEASQRYRDIYRSFGFSDILIEHQISEIHDAAIRVVKRAMEDRKEDINNGAI